MVDRSLDYTTSQAEAAGGRFPEKMFPSGSTRTEFGLAPILSGKSTSRPMNGPNSRGTTQEVRRVLPAMHSQPSGMR